MTSRIFMLETVDGYTQVLIGCNLCVDKGMLSDAGIRGAVETRFGVEDDVKVRQKDKQRWNFVMSTRSSKVGVMGGGISSGE